MVDSEPTGIILGIKDKFGLSSSSNIPVLGGISVFSALLIGGLWFMKKRWLRSGISYSGVSMPSGVYDRFNATTLGIDEIFKSVTGAETGGLEFPNV